MTDAPKSRHFLDRAAGFHSIHVREEMKELDSFNAKFALLITKFVGSMWCAYLFAAIAFIGLPPALKPGGEGIIAWIAQTFLQLVLLSVIMVGQDVQSQAADARSVATEQNTQTMLDRLDLKTQGGIRDAVDEICRHIDTCTSGTK